MLQTYDVRLYLLAMIPLERILTMCMWWHTYPGIMDCEAKCWKDSMFNWGSIGDQLLQW
jgi:hypothetical protein